MESRTQLNHFDRYDKHELDTSFADPKLEAEYLAYKNGPRQETKDTQTKELAAQLHDANVEAAKKFRFEKQDELVKERFGRVIYCLDFLKDLNKIIPARYAAVSKYGLLKLQVLVPTENGGEWQFVCGVQAGYNAEYSTFYFDEHGLPTSEMYRGWRTVLLRLITGGFISEEKAHKIFGEATGLESRRYREQLYHYRNR